MTNNQKHILVVDDEVHLAKGIQYNLEQEGYRVTRVLDGASALKLLQNLDSSFHLVILDLMLPGMSGYVVCETLREVGNHVPVLILSARTLTEDRTRGFDVGANQYLTKPFELEELLSRVKNLLTLSAHRQSTVEQPFETESFEFASAKIDFETHEVRVDGKPIRLTHLELKLLRYFVVNAGRVITRKELLENVWEMPGNVTTRAPDQFIRRLRKYFEPDPAVPRYFLTLRDSGYRFVSDGKDA